MKAISSETLYKILDSAYELKDEKVITGIELALMCCVEFQKWQNIDDFLKDPKDEWCWIKTKENIIDMAFFHIDSFYFNEGKVTKFPIGKIIEVMHIEKPQI